MKKLFTFLSIVICLVVLGSTADAQTPVPMSSQGGLTYTENFSDIANWTNNFAAGIGASRWGSVAVNATGTIPDGVKTTTSTATFQISGSSSGVQRGSLAGNVAGTIVMLGTGATDNTTSLGIDFLMDFTGVNAGTFTYTGATVNNGTNNRPATLRVYWSTNGTTFTEITSAKYDTYNNNATTSQTFTTISLPSNFNNSSTARLRFYYSNGGTPGATNSGSRPKISIDNLTVTAVSAGGLTPPTLTAAPGATVDGAFNVTFADDATWRAAITGITVAGVTLTAGSNVTSGQIAFTPSSSNPTSALQTSGTKTIVVSATGYNDASVSQTISPGAANKLAISLQPAAPSLNGGALGTQPIVLIQDQYGNTSTSTATVVANVGAGTWTIGGTSSLAGVSGTVTFTNLTATSAALVTGATIDFTSTGLTHIESGTFNIPAPVSQGLQLSAVATEYLIDFDNTVANVNEGTYVGTGFSPTPATGQLNSLSWAVTGWSDGDLAFGGIRTTAATDYTRGVSAIAVGTGGMYAFTIGGNTALGFQSGTNDWAPGTLKLKAQNKTGVTATTLLISYKLLVRNDQGRSSSFNFSYSNDDATYTPASSLDYTSPTTLDAAGWKTYIKVYTVTVNLATDGYYYFRWSGADVAGSGSRDEFAIDDFKIIVNPTAGQYPSFAGTCEDYTSDGNSGLSGDLTVNGTLNMTNGIINTNGNTLTIGTSTSNTGNITRTGGSINGTLKRWFAAAPTTNTIFPLDNGSSQYVEANISFTGAGPTTGGTLTASYTTTGSGLLPVGPNAVDRYIDAGARFPGVNFINLSPQFWTITAADGLAGYAYDIALTANAMGVSTTATLYTGIVKRVTGSGNTWAWDFNRHVDTQGSTTPILGGTGFTSFSDFAVVGNIDNLLPVELSGFTSVISGRDVNLSWITNMETNNSGFDIERKSTVTGWTKIGNVAGHGNTNTQYTYSYSDRNISSGRYSYRLKQIDYNGNYKYYTLSNEITLGTPTKFALSQNYPNPFNPATTISYELPNSNFVSLKVYDMMGREVANLVNANQEAGFYTVKFDASRLSSGIYFYKLQANDFSSTKKLMLLK